jgi:diguanylate cyclase (GGDEF)-like protein
MTPVKKISDEEGRVLALERYEVLDTDEGEVPFENIVNLVQQTLRVPMCAVSLVDHHRQWFKARRGLGVRETARNISFCTHAIEQDDAFIIENALEHPLFKDNPLVTGEPYIRAYLGIPLRTPDGYNVGSLCGIDHEPRKFLPHEVEIMKSFAKLVVDELELRQIATSDGLTGALTRRAWMEGAASEVIRAQRYGKPLSFAILDIDKFKGVNDLYGHPSGDKVIQFLADICMQEQRQSDLFGRLGGEEFAFVLTDTSGENAYSFVNRVRQRFEESEIEISDGIKVGCTLSAGVAELTSDEDVESVIARADRCLYEAKAGGRNRVILDNSVTTADDANRIERARPKNRVSN